MCTSCKQQKPGDAKFSTPIKKTYKNTTDDFWNIIGTDYKNSTGTILKWDSQLKKVLWQFPTHSTPRFLARSTHHCFDNINCTCSQGPCYELSLSQLPCTVEFSGTIQSVLSAGGKVGKDSQILWTDITSSIDYSDSFVEQSTSNKFGSFAEQQKYYCENLFTSMKSVQVLPIIFDSKTIILALEGIDLGLILQTKTKNIPDESLYILIPNDSQ